MSQGLTRKIRTIQQRSMPPTLAVIAVHDHGPGIPPDERSRIFRPYWRGQRAHGIGGLGLGLHVVQQIVEAHGGKIGLE